MTTFDERERAFETRFAHDRDLAFRAQARRNREIGLWAARQLGMSGEDADAYATQVLLAAVETGGTAAVVARIATDLRGHGLAVTDHQVRRRLDELMVEAVDHVRHA